MVLKFISKALGVCGYVIQYGCITHCTFEYIGDFVVCVGPSMEPTLTTNNVLITDRISPRLSKLQRGDIIITKSPTNPVQHVCKRIIGMPGDRIMTKASFNLNPLSNTHTIYTTVIPSPAPSEEDLQTLRPPSNASTAKQLSATVAKLREKVDFVSSSVDETPAGPHLPAPNTSHQQQQQDIYEPDDFEATLSTMGHAAEPRTSIVTVPRGHLWIEGDNVQNSSDSRNYGPVPIGLVKSRAICRLWPLSEFKLFI